VFLVLSCSREQLRQSLRPHERRMVLFSGATEAPT
jgi:hypothetical protein